MTLFNETPKQRKRRILEGNIEFLESWHKFTGFTSSLEKKEVMTELRTLKKQLKELDDI